MLGGAIFWVKLYFLENDERKCHELQGYCKKIVSEVLDSENYVREGKWTEPIAVG